MHIVIIEDEQGIRQELSQLLRDALYEVTAIENFEQLSEKVLDSAGSGFTGLEFAGNIGI